MINFLGRVGDAEPEQIVELDSLLDAPPLQVGDEPTSDSMPQNQQTQLNPVQPTSVSTKMLDFEGGGVRDESGGPSIADTSDQSNTGQLLASTNIGPGIISTQFDHESRNEPDLTEDLLSESVLELLEFSESDRPENTEPFE